MSHRLILAALCLALVAGAAEAQTYDPAQSQQRLNQLQLDIQSQHLQQLQRQNNQALQQADPGVRAQAAATQLQLNQQAAANLALRQQTLSPSADPSSLTAQLQASGVQIQQIQPQPPTP